MPVSHCSRLRLRCSRILWLSVRSAKIRAVRHSARVRDRRGIIAALSPVRSTVSRSRPAVGRSPVDTVSVGNNTALPGVVTYWCPDGAVQITVPSGNCRSRHRQNDFSK